MLRMTEKTNDSGTELRKIIKDFSMFDEYWRLDKKKEEDGWLAEKELIKHQSNHYNLFNRSLPEKVDLYLSIIKKEERNYYKKNFLCI